MTPCLLKGMMRYAQMNRATGLENGLFSMTMCAKVSGERHLKELHFAASCIG